VIVLVTPAQQDLARLDLELADRLRQPRDPRMEAIAKAEYVEPNGTVATPGSPGAGTTF
jgi:hypothetical protein